MEPTDNQNPQEKDSQLKKVAGLILGKTQTQQPVRRPKADKVTDHIYLGCYSSSCNKQFLQQEGITRVLMCLGHLQPPFPGQFTYKQISVRDCEQQDIMKHFEEAYQFIEEGIFNNEKILVHCYAGVSRSVAVLAAYFIKRDKKDPNQVIDFLREKREGVCPNSGFIMQLWMYYSYIESIQPKPREPVELTQQPNNKSQSIDQLVGEEPTTKQDEQK